MPGHISTVLGQDGYGHLPMRDATMKEGAVDIKVSAHDCRVGTTKSPTDCAAARGAKRTLRATAVYVMATRAYIVYDMPSRKEVVRYGLGGVAQQAIRDFDSGKIVFANAVVRFDPVAPSQRLGKTGRKRGGTGKRDKSRSKARKLRTR